MASQRPTTKSITELLEMNLKIPDYQRPYKWDVKNINDLLIDITNALADAKKYGDDFKYRIGTVILHETVDGGEASYHIVDGQQRIISLVLLRHCIDRDFSCSILKEDFTNKTTQYNIHSNFAFIKEWFAFNDEMMQDFIEAFTKILEVVVICVENVTEAFQLFDSQNTRGKELDPHDLLKAYHLREMKSYPYEMEHAVTKWEAKDTESIKELFDLYLYPIWNWSHGRKSKRFTAKEIDTYKGVSEGSNYYYAKRASKAMPYFQITAPFIAGGDFFEMVDHYINLLHDIKSEICSNAEFGEIKKVLCGGRSAETPEEMDKIKCGSTGFRYAKNLFFCALLCYYDKFHNFDEMAVKKLFSWAFMLRVDMENLGYDSINKYAIGDENSRYTNRIAVFSKIDLARMHYEICAMQINVSDAGGKLNSATSERKELYNSIRNINTKEVSSE